MCIPQKENYLQLMPTHQLYHSAHSCHLDHFLLRGSLSSECCQSFEQCAAVQIPSRRGWLSQGPAAPFKRGVVEKCAKARIRNPFWLRVYSIVKSSTGLDVRFIQSTAAAAVGANVPSPRRKKKKRETILPPWTALELKWQY